MPGHDFDKRHAAHRRRMDQAQRIAIGGFWLCVAGSAAVAALIIYTLMHPELIGTFLGQIARAFQVAR